MTYTVAFKFVVCPSMLLTVFCHEGIFYIDVKELHLILKIFFKFCVTLKTLQILRLSYFEYPPQPLKVLGLQIQQWLEPLHPATQGKY